MDRAKPMLEPPLGGGRGGAKHSKAARAASEGVLACPVSSAVLCRPKPATATFARIGRFFANAAARQGCGMLMRYKTYRNVKLDLGSEGRATDVLAPAPGQGDEPGHAPGTGACQIGRAHV